MERLEALLKRLNAFRALRERVGSFSRLGSIKTCRHKQKDNLVTFGSVLERLEMFGKRLKAFRTIWERMGAFGKLGRPVSIIPYVCMYACMYGMYGM